MEFTDRMMAVDRAVSSYLRFAGEPTPPPSEAVPELWADLLHWHERFVVSRPPMSKREVRRFVNEAIKTFYEERDAIARGEEPMKRPRREHPPEVIEARRMMRAEEHALLRRMRDSESRPVPVDPGPVNPEGCDHCGREVELFHNDRTGLSLCETCDELTNTAEAPRYEPMAEVPLPAPFTITRERAEELVSVAWTMPTEEAEPDRADDRPDDNRGDSRAF